MADGNQPPGLAFQNLVATLERVLSGREGVDIVSPRLISDKDTGTLREHDIVITWKDAHHEKRTAIECKDTGRKVGLPQIEAFAKKCEKTGIHHPVIVSSQGFTKSAWPKAAALGVDLMMLSEVEQFDWMGVEFLVGYQRQFGDVNVQIMFNDEMPSEIDAIYDTEGKMLDAENLTATVVSCVPVAENPDDEVGKRLPVQLKLQTVDWTARDLLGRMWPIDHLLAEANFTTIKTINPVVTHRYVGGGKAYEIASADMQLGDVRGKFVLVRNDDRSTSVYWTPAPRGKGN